MPDARRATIWTITALPGHASLCGVAWEGEDHPMPRGLQRLLDGMAAFAKAIGPRRWPGQRI